MSEDSSRRISNSAALRQLGCKADFASPGKSRAWRLLPHGPPRDCSLIPIEERNIKLNSSYRRIDVDISFIATREEQVGPAVCLLKPGLRFRFGDCLFGKLPFRAQRYGIRASRDWLWSF
jgi:hypothetical protein